MRAYKEPSLMVLNTGITLKSSGELFKNRMPQLYSKLIKSEFWGGEGVGPIYHTVSSVFCSGFFISSHVHTSSRQKSLA